MACVALLGSLASADTWIDTHDEPSAAWEVDTSMGATVIARERVRIGGARQGEEVGAERIAYAAAPGIPTWAWRTVPPAAVIDELKITLDVRATVPGTLLAAEVVLPRSTGSDGRPVRLRVRSSPAQGSRGGNVRLELTNLPQRVQREARVWRLANPGTKIDTRGAYVTRLAVGLPGSGRPAEAWVREAQLASLVTPLRRVDEATDETASDTPAVVSNEAGVKRPTRVSLRSEGFRIDNELYYPRVWRWRGEPFPALAARGINTVWLEQPPTPQQLAQAAHHRLRVFCPPPKSPEAAAAVPTWDRVLAWVLPGTQSQRDIDASLVAIEAARGLNKSAQRPLLVYATEAAAEWSRLVDGLLLDAGSTGASLEEVPPGTPVITVARLDVGPAVVGQLDALLGDGVATTWLPPADLLGSVGIALQRQAAGIAFLAEERIDEADDATAGAAGWLEAVNRRLRLIEPWLVGPRSVSPLTGSSSGALLDRGGVRLAASNSLSRRAPIATDQNPPTISLPGIHESSRTYRLSVAGLAAWPIERQGGRVVAELPSEGSPGDLLICNDPRVVRSLRDYTRKTAPRAAANLIKVTEVLLRQTEAVTPADRQTVLGRLGTARLAMSRRDYATAYDSAHAALSIVSASEVERRRIARQGPWESSSPLAVLPGTLTDHFRMSQLLSASPRGANRLYGGSFENIDELRRFGWRHPAGDNKHGNSKKGDFAAKGSVELVETEAQHGERVLRLTNRSQVVSPELELFVGETLEITGFARIDSAAGQGELVVTDSLGGDELALHLADTDGEWRPFHLLRAAGADSAMTVTFATRGIVTAEVDGVMVRAIEPLGVASRPQRQAK